MGAWSVDVGWLRCDRSTAVCPCKGRVASVLTCVRVCYGSTSVLEAGLARLTPRVPLLCQRGVCARARAERACCGWADTVS